SATKLTALAIALRRLCLGKNGWARRSTESSILKNGPHHADRYGPRIQSRTFAGGVRNHSSTEMLCELRRVGRSATSPRMVTITVRDQYEIVERWKGSQGGRCVISGGIPGTARQGSWPNRASCARVKTLVRSAPPAARMAARARSKWGALGSSPIALKAKYAFTLADR